MRKLVFVTNNVHKLDEVRSMLKGKMEVLSLADIDCYVDIPETADTLNGNAALKARYVYEHYGLDCFADDTGLEVEALGGAPGVRTARYAGDGHNPEANIQKIMQVLKNETNRKAQFRTAICLIEGGRETFFEGIVRGEILSEKRGIDGFGYDPVFAPEGYSGKSFAELGVDIKNQISHRARAVQALTDYLNRK